MINDFLPQPERIPFFQADTTPIAGDIFKAAAKDAWLSMPWAKTRRAREYFLESEFAQKLRGEESNVLTVDQLNRDYGIRDHLKFDSPMTEEQARLRHMWKLDELERRSVLDRGEGFWNGAIKLGAGFSAAFADPIMLGFIFAPGFKEFKAAKAAQAGASLSLGRIAGQELLMNGATEAYAAAVSSVTDREYTAKDAFFNAAAGTFLSVGVSALGKVTGSAMRNAQKRAAKHSMLTQFNTMNSMMAEIITEKSGGAEYNMRLDPVELRTRAAIDVEHDISMKNQDVFGGDGFRVSDAGNEDSFNLNLRSLDGEAIPDPMLDGVPVYTTLDPETKRPLMFSDSLEDMVGAASDPSAQVYASVLDMQNPTDLPTVMGIASKLGVDTDNLVDAMSNVKVRKALSDAGFDGVVGINEETGNMMYSVLNKKQVSVPDGTARSKVVATAAEVRDRIDQRVKQIVKSEQDNMTAVQKAQFEKEMADAEAMRRPDPETVQAEEDEILRIERETTDVEQELGPLSPEEEAIIVKETQETVPEQSMREAAQVMMDCILEKF